MIPYSRRGPRRPPPRMLPADVAQWRRLIRQARLLAERPLGDPQPLRRCADKSTKTVLPPAAREPGNPFSALIALGRRFPLGTGVQKQREAAELTRLAGLCQAALDAAEAAAERPARRFRQDIDG